LAFFFFLNILEEDIFKVQTSYTGNWPMLCPWYNVKESNKMLMTIQSALRTNLVPFNQVVSEKLTDRGHIKTNNKR
jgi:hypothetical protein